MDPTGGYDSDAFVAEFYDEVVPYRDRADVDFYLDTARDADGPLLEVGCGTGRILIPTARAGVEITGLELSERMLSRCREKLAAEPPEVRRRVRLETGDMRRFDLGREFALATLPFRPFQHLRTVGDQLACLAAVRRHLRPGGRIVLDLFNPSLAKLADRDFGKIVAEEPPFEMPDGRVIVRRHRMVDCDYATQVISAELIYDVTHPDGRTERLVHGFPMRYLFRYEAEHLLARAGFSVEQVYGDYDRTPFGEMQPGELILLARR